jgi:predicted nucleic acid-binding protein
MIILDTNVVSETMKLVCDPAVTDWFDRQVDETLYRTAIGVLGFLLWRGARQL